MTVVPMVFAALVVGVYELGREHGLGGVAARTLLFTLLLSAASVTIGVDPGQHRPSGREPSAAAVRRRATAAAVQTLETNAAAAKPLRRGA